MPNIIFLVLVIILTNVFWVMLGCCIVEVFVFNYQVDFISTTVPNIIALGTLLMYWGLIFIMFTGKEKQCRTYFQAKILISLITILWAPSSVKLPKKF